MYKTAYVPPTLTVDAVIFELINDALHVLLIKRSSEPFKNAWAMPGGYNPVGETTHDALKRIILKKAGIDIDADLGYVEQLYTFDTVARDPRGHAVSVTYMGCGLGIAPRSSASEHPQFFPVDKLPELAYDHAEIIDYAVQRLRAKITYTNAVFALLPNMFTLSQLQTAYEAIIGHELDKRNFRKKFMQLDLIEPTNEKHMSGAHRPAQLYRFKAQKLESLSRSFD